MTSMAVDGEAPETDDETETGNEHEEFTKNAKLMESKPETKKATNVCKNLEKRWTQAAVKTISNCQKRSSNHEKTMQRVTDSATDCFTSMQNVAAKLTVIHTNVTRLEDSVADLLEATQMIPNKYSNINFNIPQFL